MKKIILLMFLFSIITYTDISKKIGTSNQLAYTLTKNLVKNTNLEVVSVLDAYSDMFNQRTTFKNLDNKEELFRDLGVVVTLTNLLKDDFLYEQARRYNKGVINIDLSYSYRDNSSLVILKKINENGNILPYAWLDFSNMYRMIDILKEDLIDIYPENREIITENSNYLKNELINLSNNFMKEIYESKEDIGVIQIGNSELDYFLDSLEIYHENIPQDSDIELINKTIIETGLNKIVFYKSLSKDILNKLDDLCIKYTKLELGNIPQDLDEDDEMDDDGYIDILKNDIDKLRKLLLTRGD